MKRPRPPGRATRWPDAPQDAGWGIGVDLDDAAAWGAREGAYAALHRTKPQTAAVGLTNLTIYWLTATIGSSTRMYRANGAISPERHARRVEVPSGFSLFPADLVRPPRAWLERTTNLVRMTEPERGGHFAPFEEPELYAQELREFFRPYRAGASTAAAGRTGSDA